MSHPQRVLVSVSDKSGLVPFVQGLAELGFEIVSTGGTRSHLQQAGLTVIDISEYTGFPEMMEGRVKTLHPKVHGGLLGRPNIAEHAEAMTAHGIIPFQLVICNLYPFEATVAKPDVSLDEAIENIDIGGPSMIRSAAKNQEHVGVVTDPAQYEDVLTALRNDLFDLAFRRRLATQAFTKTAAYDAAISSYFRNRELDESTAADLPETLSLQFRRQESLRYGENPHQRF